VQLFTFGVVYKQPNCAAVGLAFQLVGFVVAVLSTAQLQFWCGFCLLGARLGSSFSAFLRFLPCIAYSRGVFVVLSSLLLFLRGWEP